MVRNLVAAGAALALSACGPTEEPKADNAAPEANLANAMTGGNDAAAVLEMPDSTRRLVLARALFDAGIDCDGVTRAEHVADQDGAPVWRATCKNGTQHAIAITPDGTANIVSRTGRQ